MILQRYILHRITPCEFFECANYHRRYGFSHRSDHHGPTGAARPHQSRLSRRRIALHVKQTGSAGRDIARWSENPSSPRRNAKSDRLARQDLRECHAVDARPFQYFFLDFARMLVIRLIVQQHGAYRIGEEANGCNKCCGGERR